MLTLPEHCLHVDNSFGIGHVIFLGAHGALFIHNDQVIGVDDPALEQAVQTEIYTHNKTAEYIKKWM